MPTLRRILKYTPAVVLGMLAVAWLISCFVDVGLWTSAFMLRIAEGSVDLVSRFDGLVISDAMPILAPSFEPGLKLGYFYVSETGIAAPIPAIATLILPLAIGPFLSFRFRLWHYLAYTALVAVELAYYLRWQE